MEEVIQKKENKNRIIGVELLRFYMCFMVVFSHFGGKASLPGGFLFYLFIGFHVPVFMLLSFFFCSKYFLEPTKQSVVSRLLRLIIPFFFWGILGFLLALPFYDLSIKVLGMQVLLGFPIHSPMWYLAVTIWISLLYWLIRILTNKKWFIIIISALAVFAIVAQYTGLNYLMFKDVAYEMRIPFGRILEMIPYASIGILLSLLIPTFREQTNKLKTIIFCVSLVLLALLVVGEYFLFKDTTAGFDYPGAYKIVMAFLLVISALTNPLNIIENERFRLIIKWVTSFTLGIYCLHYILGWYIEYLFVSWGLPTGTILICVPIYLISYLICYLISLIPCKYTKMLVR